MGQSKVSVLTCVSQQHPCSDPTLILFGIKGGGVKRTLVGFQGSFILQ